MSDASTIITDTFGRIRNLLSIGDVDHAKSLFNALLEEWNAETRGFDDFDHYEQEIRICRARRSTRSRILNEFINSGAEAFCRKWGRPLGIMKRAYASSTGNPHFYIYFLLDMDILESDPSFRTFISSIVYVGKGTKQRARDHADKALAVPPNELKFQSRKLQKLRHLLDSPRHSIGIVRSNIGVKSDLALAFECSVLRTMGLETLTNAKLEQMPKINKKNGRDQDYGRNKKEERPNWSDEMIETVGVDRLVDAWKGHVIEISRDKFKETTTIDWEEEEEIVRTRKEKKAKEEKVAEAARKRREQGKKRKERKRQSQELKHSGVLQGQKEEQRKRQHPLRLSPSAENKRKKH